MKRSYLVCAALLVCGASAARACEGTRLEALYRINSETEAKIQARVVDKVLGPGRAFVFLETKAEVKSSVNQELKGGVGETRKVMPKAPDADAAAPAKGEKEVSTQEQRATQEKKSSEARDELSLSISALTVRILHENTVPSVKLRAVKTALLALYSGRIEEKDIVFIPIVFDIQSLR